MEGVVGPLGIQTDFNVVVFAASLPQNLSTLWQKSPLTSRTSPARLRVGVCCPIAQQLVGERIHAATGLAAADGTDDDRARKQPAFRDDEPTGFLCGDRKARIVNLPRTKLNCFSRPQRDKVAEPVAFRLDEAAT